MYIRIIENEVIEEERLDYKKAMEFFVEDLLKLEECVSIDIVETSKGVTTIERWENESNQVMDILLKHKKALKKGFTSNTEQIFQN